MMTNPIGGLTANNAAFRLMSASNSLMNLASFKGGNLAAIRNAENKLTLNMLHDNLLYKAGLLMQESQDKIAKENIKRSFSIFA